MKFNYITKPVNLLQVPYRVISTLIVRLIADTFITPNIVTVTRTLIVIYSLFLISTGNTTNWIYAVILFIIFEILDHVDGDLARHKNILSANGYKLEQFVDTWASRPSNIFGFVIAYGYYKCTNSFDCFYPFVITNFGRLMWLEYRDYFEYSKEEEKSQYLFMIENGKINFTNIFKVIYIWNNIFLLFSLITYGFFEFLGLNILVLSFYFVAFINNLPWLFITTKSLKN